MASEDSPFSHNTIQRGWPIFRILARLANFQLTGSLNERTGKKISAKYLHFIFYEIPARKNLALTRPKMARDPQNLAHSQQLNDLINVCFIKISRRFSLFMILLKVHFHWEMYINNLVYQENKSFTYGRANCKI